MFNIEDYNYFLTCDLDINLITIHQIYNVTLLTISIVYDENENINKFKKFENYIVEKYNMIRIENVDEINFNVNYDTNIFLPEKINKLQFLNYKNNIINLNNLPKQLKELELNKARNNDFITYNITNLPNQLEKLVLSGNVKFNLDFLPENLKKIQIYYYESYGVTCYKNILKDIYTLEELHNLPTGLEEININDNIYYGVDELINLYNNINDRGKYYYKINI